MRDIQDIWDWFSGYWIVIVVILVFAGIIYGMIGTVLQEPERCSNIGTDLQIQTKYVEGDCYLLSNGGWIKESEDSDSSFLLPFVIGLSLGSAGR